MNASLKRCSVGVQTASRILCDIEGALLAPGSQEIPSMKRTLFTLALVAAGATAANAYHPSGNGIDGRHWNQERRIEQGLGDGSLSPREYWSLKHEQRRIQALENRAWRDGALTPYERYQLRRAQHNASWHIYRERHDGEYRRWPRWAGYGWGWRRWWWY
jgi:hypothetical protein